MSTRTEEETELLLATPKEYKVLLLNDDYSTMDFVVNILMSIFYKTYEQSESIMIEVHKKGKGLCGIYSYEIAETKVEEVHKKAKDAGFPLKAVIEESEI